MSEEKRHAVRRSHLEKIFGGFINDMHQTAIELGRQPSDDEVDFLNWFAVTYRLRTYGAFIERDQMSEYRDLALAGELGDDERETVMCEIRVQQRLNAPRGSCVGYAAVRAFHSEQG